MDNLSFSHFALLFFCSSGTGFPKVYELSKNPLYIIYLLNLESLFYNPINASHCCPFLFTRASILHTFPTEPENECANWMQILITLLTPTHQPAAGDKEAEFTNQ